MFGPGGAMVGRLAGALAGNFVDNAILNRGGGSSRSYEGPRLSDLEMMASTEGAPIPPQQGKTGRRDR